MKPTGSSSSVNYNSATFKGSSFIRHISQDRTEKGTNCFLIKSNQTKDILLDNPFPYYTTYNQGYRKFATAYTQLPIEKHEIIKSLYKRKPRGEFKLSISKESNFPSQNIDELGRDETRLVSITDTSLDTKLKLPGSLCFDKFNITTLNSTKSRQSFLPSIKTYVNAHESQKLPTNPINCENHSSTNTNMSQQFKQSSNFYCQTSSESGSRIYLNPAKYRFSEIIKCDDTANTKIATIQESKLQESLEKTYDISFNQKKNGYGSKAKGLVQEFYYFQDQNSAYKDKMEDFSKTIENFGNCPSQILFTLYDGHGGQEIARFCKDNFPVLFGNQINNLNNKLLKFSGADRESNLIEKIKVFLKSSFIKTDMNSKAIQNSISGSTAICAFLIEDSFKKYLFTTNLGDSSAFIINKDYIKKLSVDHKCTDPREAKRVINEGGTILSNRVMGELMVTRAFGDHKLKMYGVTADPSINVRVLTENDIWLIIASDGIWDVITEIDLKQFSKKLKSSEDFTKLLVKTAKSRGSRDNISCLAIKL